MKNIKKLLFIIVFLGVFLITPFFVSAATIEELQAQIAALLKQISQLQVQIAQIQGQTTAVWCHDFNVNLKIGDYGGKDSDVAYLIGALEKEGLLPLGTGGTAGGGVSITEKIASAVSGFQQKYKSEILTPLGLQYGTGYVGTATRAKLNKLYGCGIVKPPVECAPAPYTCPQFSPTAPCPSGYKQVCEQVKPDVCGCYPPPSCKCIPITEPNQPPVIHGVSGPTTLKINETGTWTVQASDPEQGILTYSVVWGDEVQAALPLMPPYKPSTYTQTATFTHSYSKAGVYTPTFMITDNQGLSAKTGISVNVGEIITHSITVLSPNGGERWTLNTRTDSDTCSVLHCEEIKWSGGSGTDWRSVSAYLEQYVNNQFVTVGKIPAYGYGSISWPVGIIVSTSCTGDSYPDLYNCTKSLVNPGQYYVRLVDKVTGATDRSDAAFSIVAAGTCIQKDSSCCLNGFCALTNITCVIGSSPSFQGCSSTCLPKWTCIPSTQPSITVLSPNGGESWNAGNTYLITWRSSGVSNINLSLNPETSGGITACAQGQTITYLPASSGSYSLTVPSNMCGGKYKVKLVDYGNSAIEDSSDAPFSIVAASTACTDSDGGKNYSVKGIVTDTGKSYADYCQGAFYLKEYFCLPSSSTGLGGAAEEDVVCPNSGSCVNGACVSPIPSITVLSPNGGETWEVGSTQRISWQTNNILSPNDKITIYIAPNDDLSKNINIAQQISNTGSYDYTVRDPSEFSYRSSLFKSGNQFKIFVCAQLVGNNDLCSNTRDYSDAAFSIVAAATIACTDSDSGQDYYKRGTATGLYGSGTAKGIIYGEGDGDKFTYRYDPSLNYSIYYDHCFDSATSKQLNEGYCDANGILQSIGTTCPYGCKNGVCVTVTPSITFSRTPQTSQTSPFVAGNQTTATWQFSPWSSFQGYNWTLKSKTTDTVTGASVNDADFVASWSDIVAQNLCNSTGYCALTASWEASQFQCSANVNNIRKREDWVVANGVESNHNVFYFKCSNSTIGLMDIEDQLASIAGAVSQLIERMKELIAR